MSASVLLLWHTEHRSIGDNRILEIQGLPVPDNNINKDVQERSQIRTT